MLALLLGVAAALNADLSADAVQAANFQAKQATKPHPGITTVNLVPTQRRHLIALAQQQSSTVVEHPHGTTTVSLIPTHKEQHVQLLQTAEKPKMLRAEKAPAPAAR